MNQPTPQMPYFTPLKRTYLNEKELNAPLKVVEIAVYGSYTARGEHRKEIVEKQFEGTIEVPENFNKGHVKLAVNRFVKREMKGIRAREFHVDEDVTPKPLEHRRKVMEFMSKRGLRDNERLKRNYIRDMKKRKAESDAMANGQVPQFMDDSEYGNDGLPKFSDRTYVMQGADSE